VPKSMNLCSRLTIPQIQICAELFVRFYETRCLGFGQVVRVSSLFTEQELVLALQSKNIRGLECLYDLYGDLMYSLALHILKSPQEAEDLVQEIILNLWNQFSYNPQRGKLKTFLMVLVRSRAIDRLRSHQSKQQTLARLGHEDKDLPSSIPMAAAVSDEVAQRVQQALADLPLNQRQALELAYYEGLSQTEIAQKLSIPVGTVKSWIRLSFVKLRKSLQDLGS
jgi:RNA polymerase sigma-70 factor, ECF subfamily